MSALWLHLAALLVYGPAIVLLHELGHAALARVGGYRVTDFQVGLGPPLFRFDLRGGVVLHVARWIPFGGACTAIPIGPPSARRAWFHAGGLIAQGLLAIAILPWLGHEVVRHALVFNALVAVHNGLPWRAGALASDGWHLVDALTGGAGSTDLVAQRAALERLEARTARAGSPLGRAYARILLAWADVLVGRYDAAAPLFREDPPATTVEPWVDALYHHVRAEWERQSGRPLAAVRTAREALEAVELERVGDGQALLALAEARALVDLGAAPQAQRALAKAAGVGGSIGRQASVVLLWASLEGGADDLELAAWRVARRGGPFLDPADAAMALWEAARSLEEANRHTSAEHARRAALELARARLARIPASDRRILTQRLGEVAGMAATGAAALGS